MNEKWKWLEKYAPLGIGVKKQVIAYLTGLSLATLQSLLFLFNYIQARDDLYRITSSGPVVDTSIIMVEFSDLTEFIFLGFYVMILVTLLCTVFFYMYHYDGSHMMYLMRRLPDKWELHRRCLTLPVAGAILLILWMCVVKMIYYAIYILCTPSQCLPL